MSEPNLRPDHDIECFWMGFKQSMINFYGQKLLPPRNIENWSARLNKLQAAEQYDKIESQIHNYITLFGLDLLRANSRYHLGILITNIKRWDKLSKKYPVLHAGSSSNEDLRAIQQHQTYDNNIVTILLEIAASFIKCGQEFDGIFDDLELYMIYDDYTRLVDYALQHKKTIIFDRLIKFNYLAVSDALREITGQDFSHELAGNISGKKLLEKLACK